LTVLQHLRWDAVSGIWSLVSSTNHPDNKFKPIRTWLIQSPQNADVRVKHPACAAAFWRPLEPFALSILTPATWTCQENVVTPGFWDTQPLEMRI